MKIDALVFIPTKDGHYHMELVVTKETLENAMIFDHDQLIKIKEIKLTKLQGIGLWINRMVNGKMYGLTIRPKDNEYTMLTDTPLDFEKNDYFALFRTTSRSRPNEVDQLKEHLLSWIRTL
jgi:hypothetical protein